MSFNDNHSNPPTRVSALHFTKSKFSSPPNSKMKMFLDYKEPFRQVLSSTLNKNQNCSKQSLKNSKIKDGIIPKLETKSSIDENSDKDESLNGNNRTSLNLLENKVRNSIACLRKSILYINPESFFTNGILKGENNSSLYLEKQSSEITELEILYKNFNENEKTIKLQEEKNKKMKLKIEQQKINISNLKSQITGKNKDQILIDNIMHRILNKNTKGFMIQLKDALTNKDGEFAKSKELTKEIEILTNSLMEKRKSHLSFQ